MSAKSAVTSVSISDIYYQTVPYIQGIRPSSLFFPGGRNVPWHLGTDAELAMPQNLEPVPPGLVIPRQNVPRWEWATNTNYETELPLGEPNLSVFLGGREETNQRGLVDNVNNQDFSEFSRYGWETPPSLTNFDLTAPHGSVLNWYAGTVNLGWQQFPHSPSSGGTPVEQFFNKPRVIHRRQADRVETAWQLGNPGDHENTKPWYTPEYLTVSDEVANGNPNAYDDQIGEQLDEEGVTTEGTSTGWYYSVLGGGEENRPNQSNDENRQNGVPLDFDNTYEKRLRGDFAVPTLFNGNFDASFNIETRTSPSYLLLPDSVKAIPGWDFHGGGGRTVNKLKEWKDITSLSDGYKQGVGYTEPNYALELNRGKSITHNRFVVPDWGNLRFDLHVPAAQLGDGRRVKVTLEGVSDNPAGLSSVVNLQKAVGNATSYLADTQKIGYGTQGFETFQVEVPDNLRGKVATVEFELMGGGTVYLDDVFFKSEHLLLGNPSKARNNPDNYSDNYLLEKPQYAVSYNSGNKGPNWVSWQLNQSWLGDFRRPDSRDVTPDYPYGKYDYPWMPDSSLPNNLTKTVASDYVGNDYVLERGHLTPSDDRDRTNKDIYSTFLTSNMLPQAGQLNRGVWKTVEGRSNQYVKESGNNLYIFAGGAEFNSSPIEPGYPAPLLRNQIYKRANGTFYLRGVNGGLGPTIGEIKLQELRSENPGILENAEINRVIYKNEDGTYRNETLNGSIVTSSEVADLISINPRLANLEAGKSEILGEPIRIENSKQIGVPQYFWKIILPLQPRQNLNDINEQTQVIAIIMPNRPPRAQSTGPHTIPLPNGVDDLTITDWRDWTEWQISIRDLETITGYDFFSGLPDDIETQLEARHEDHFINDYLSSSLLANNQETSSQIQFFQPGIGINFSVGHGNSHGIVPDSKNPFSSREISVNKKIFSFSNISPSRSSQGGVTKICHSDISSSERDFIGITGIKSCSNQDTIIKVGSTEVGILEISPIQVRSLETSPFQVCIMENGIHQITLAQVSFDQDNSSQVERVEARTTPINSPEVSFPIFESFTQFLSIHNSTPQSFNNLNSTAQTLWQSHFNNQSSPEITLQITDLPTGQLAEAQITNFNASGQPSAGTLLIDHNANGIGWFIDPTPRDHSEFSQLSSEFSATATPDSPAHGKYDLLTTILHETAHLYGFMAGYQPYDTYRQTSPYAFTPDGSHLDSTLHPHDLMNTHLRPGLRKLPSDINLDILESVSLLAENLPEGDITLSAPLTSMPLQAVLNGSFEENLDGWNTRGSTQLINEKVQLDENDAYLPRLSRTFTVPEGAKTLQFTLEDIQLGNSPLAPPDALEVALLDSATNTPLTALPTNLTHTDALFNLQPDGSLSRGDGVRLSGVSHEANNLSLEDSYTVYLDISHLTPGTEATLYFDLLGFGEKDAQVVIDEVQLSEQQLIPPVANDDSVTLQQGETPVLDLISNDRDADGVLSPDGITLATPPEQGTVTSTEIEQLRYTPNDGFVGTDTFTYIIADEDGLLSNPATVTVTVNNLPPIVETVSVSPEAKEGTAVTLQGTATDPGNDSLTYTWDFGDGSEPVISGSGDYL